VDGIGATVGSYRAGARIGGPPLGAAFAGISAIATAKMIANMKKTNIGSSDSSNTPPISERFSVDRDTDQFGRGTTTQVFQPAPTQTSVTLNLSGELDPRVIAIKNEDGQRVLQQETTFIVNG
jgi:hypothetical protein